MPAVKQKKLTKKQVAGSLAAQTLISMNTTSFLFPTLASIGYNYYSIKCHDGLGPVMTWLTAASVVGWLLVIHGIRPHLSPELRAEGSCGGNEAKSGL